MKRSHWGTGAPILLFLAPIAGCENSPFQNGELSEGQSQALASASAPDAGASTDAIFLFDAGPLAPVLDARAIPQFVQEMPRLPTFEPTLVRNAAGKVIEKKFNVSIAKFEAQILPPPFPKTPSFGYGGLVRKPDGSVQFERTTPGPTFEQTRGVVASITYNNELFGEHPQPVDPTLHWANPNNFPKPTRPFIPFPPGYAQAQSPITHVTHTHGIEVLPEFDGTPDLWFTPNLTRVGPEFVSNTYTQPSSNEATAFWYHDHSFGVTRLDVNMGLSGFSLLRDPNNPLDPPTFDATATNPNMLGFESVADWTGTGVTPTSSTIHTEGSFSLALAAKNYVTVKSGTMETNAALSSPILLDFFLPAAQPNPWWLGAVQLFVDCPSRSVYNAYVGQVELTGKTIGAWNTLSFPVAPALISSVGSTCSDFSVSIAVNVPYNATGLYLLDNLRGISAGRETILPSGEFEVPLIVQDRTFRTDGSVFEPTVGLNPDINPYWQLIIDGQTIMVNGKVWPNFNVKRHAYRFRILNSATQRFFRFQMSNGMPFTMIGNDGGFLNAPKVVTSWLQGVTERVDVIVDFSNLPVGTKVILQNTEQHFPPIGDPVDPTLDGRVMQFTVVDSPVVHPRPLPARLNNLPDLTPNRRTAHLIQNVSLTDQGGILQAELDGQLFHSLTTELEAVGSTVDWQFLNTTPLDHNKHVHLVEFRLIERQAFDGAAYRAAWVAANGNPPYTHPTIKIDPTPFLSGPVTGPAPEEEGWKDTIHTPANQATRIRIRFAPQDIPAGGVQPGQQRYAIDPKYSNGYIWHCHLLEHEDNEMMRPMTVIDIWRPGVKHGVGFYGNPGINHDVVDFQGVDYASRRPHISMAGQPPPARFDLWQRINNEDGDWAPQIIFNVGDRTRFSNGHIYQALVQHQARFFNAPPNPTFWQLVL